MTGGELAVRTDAQAPALSMRRADWADELMSWAAAAQKAHEIAVILCETSFVPKSMAHRPGDVTGAILTGMELGTPIMWALSNIDIIDGTPAIRAKGMRGLALWHGHELWTEETTATRAIVCGRRKGQARIERSVWTMDRAKKANLAGKKTWQAYPNDMLLNRATAEVVRLIAADALIGVSHTVDELGGDETPGVAADVPDDPPAPAKRRSIQRATKAAPVPGLPADIPAPPTVVSDAASVQAMEAAGFEVVDVLDAAARAHDAGDDNLEDASTTDDAAVGEEWPPVAEPGSGPPPADNPPPMITDAQRRRLAVAMREAGLTDRGERLSFAADVIGRELSTSNELTIDEASQVIQAAIELTYEQAAQPGKDGE